MIFSTQQDLETTAQVDIEISLKINVRKDMADWEAALKSLDCQSLHASELHLSSSFFFRLLEPKHSVRDGFINRLHGEQEETRPITKKCPKSPQKPCS